MHIYICIYVYIYMTYVYDKYVLYLNISKYIYICIYIHIYIICSYVYVNYGEGKLFSKNH